MVKKTLFYPANLCCQSKTALIRVDKQGLVQDRVKDEWTNVIWWLMIPSSIRKTYVLEYKYINKINVISGRNEVVYHN